MTWQIDAVYEGGVLRPLEPVALAESQRVKLLISDLSAGPSRPDLNLVERARQEVAALKILPSIEDVRSRLSSIPGSLSDDVVSERGDY